MLRILLVLAFNIFHVATAECLCPNGVVGHLMHEQNVVDNICALEDTIWCESCKWSYAYTYFECVVAQSEVDPNSDPGACFHGDGTLLLESGATKKFSELALGERIKTSDGRGSFSFNPVLVLPHAKNKEPATFFTLTTETGKIVDMTSSHLIPKCDLKEVTAGELVVDDCLLTVDGKETLTEIYSAAKSGIYTAITADKYIVVGSVVASSYSKDPGLAIPEQDYDQYRIQLEEMRRRQLAREPKKRLRGTPLDALVD